MLCKRTIASLLGFQQPCVDGDRQAAQLDRGKRLAAPNLQGDT